MKNKIIEKNRVIFYSPGTLFSETDTRAIPSWDTRKAVSLSKKIVQRHGAKPFGFQFETILDHAPIPDGEGGKLQVDPRVIKTSGIYFINGILIKYSDIDPKEDILCSNLESASEFIVCETHNSYKSTQLFTEKDFVVDTKGNIIERGDDPKYVSYRKAMKKQLKNKRCQ